MQGALRGTRFWVSRITPWAEGHTKPLSHPGCPVYTLMFTNAPISYSTPTTNIIFILQYLADLPLCTVLLYAQNSTAHSFALLQQVAHISISTSPWFSITAMAPVMVPKSSQVPPASRCSVGPQEHIARDKQLGARTDGYGVLEGLEKRATLPAE